MFENFLKLPSDFFDKMEKPFLNKEQQDKLYEKLFYYHNKTTIFMNNNNYNNKTIYLKKRGIFLPEIDKRLKDNITHQFNTKRVIKEYKKSNSNVNINYDINKINTFRKTFTKVNPYNPNLDKDNSDVKKEENIKPVEEDLRNINKINDIINSNINNSQENYTQININESLYLIPHSEFVCCWNCFKSFNKENSIQKDNEQMNFGEKFFCSQKCLDNFEKKQKGKFVCFECNTLLDKEQGYIEYEGEKFCCQNCKNKFKEIIENNAHKIKDKALKNNIKIDKKEDKESLDNDEYDPMEDF
jgi:YHS domain-containing protein